MTQNAGPHNLKIDTSDLSEFRYRQVYMPSMTDSSGNNCRSCRDYLYMSKLFLIQKFQRLFNDIVLACDHALGFFNHNIGLNADAYEFSPVRKPFMSSTDSA